MATAAVAATAAAAVEAAPAAAAVSYSNRTSLSRPNSETVGRLLVFDDRVANKTACRYTGHSCYPTHAQQCVQAWGSSCASAICHGPSADRPLPSPTHPYITAVCLTIIGEHSCGGCLLWVVGCGKNPEVFPSTGGCMWGGGNVTKFCRLSSGRRAHPSTAFPTLSEALLYGRGCLSAAASILSVSKLAGHLTYAVVLLNVCAPLLQLTCKFHLQR